MAVDFIAEDGLLVLGESDQTHIEDLLRFCKGWHKFAPYVGCCIADELDNEVDIQLLKSRIEDELTQDGLQDLRLQLDHKHIQIHGHYTQQTRTEFI